MAASPPAVKRACPTNERADRRGELGLPPGGRLFLHGGRPRLAAHAGFLHAYACRQRHRYGGRRPDTARLGAAGRIFAGEREALHNRPAPFLHQPHGDPRARAGGARARTQTPCQGAPAVEAVIINVLLVLMAVAVIAIDRARNLFAVIVLSGSYSFLMATVLVALDAVDVGMTEAAVGAGVSTVLLLAALHLCRSEEAKPAHQPWLPLAVSVACGAA